MFMIFHAFSIIFMPFLVRRACSAPVWHLTGPHELRVRAVEIRRTRSGGAFIPVGHHPKHPKTHVFGGFSLFFFLVKSAEVIEISPGFEPRDELRWRPGRSSNFGVGERQGGEAGWSFFKHKRARGRPKEDASSHLRAEAALLRLQKSWEAPEFVPQSTETSTEARFWSVRCVFR